MEIEMNWEPTAIYKMSNGKDKVIFQNNINGIFLISEHKKNRNRFANPSQAREIWKEYLKKGYKKF